MENNEVLEMYEKNQELIEEMWEDLIEDENDIKTLVFNFDNTPLPL